MDERPLTGSVVCCTSIPPDQRAQLATIATSMGAIIKLDLTSDVTHLIVGSTDSAKYRYVAKSREDVKVLSPAWLEALRQVWVEGGDNVDVTALESDYRLPTFYGLNICLTGFDNPEQRRNIQDAVEANGAEYHGDLTKSVTHLIAATPTGKKYEHALNWRMKIVSIEWLEQSIERGMALDETLYNPTMRIEERGQGAWDPMHMPSPAHGKRSRAALESQSANTFRRKLRRSASTKVGTQSEALWAGITAASRGRQNIEDEDDWTDDIPANREASHLNIHENLNEPALVAQRDAPIDLDARYHADRRASPPQANSHHGIFGDRLMFLHGFDKEKTKILRDHLDSNGARVVLQDEIKNFTSEELRQGYVVIPHDATINPTDLPDQAAIMILVTNWWIERCLYGKYLFDPADHILSRPFDRLSISGFSDLTINSTGFVGIELLHLTKFVALMGATYDEQLSPKTSVMICNSRSLNTSKLKFTIEKHIPAVHVTWLWDCLRTGKSQPFDRYQVSNVAPDQQKPRQRPDPFTEAPMAKLSEEDSFKLRQKKVQAADSANKPQREHGIGHLDLALSAEATPASLTDSLTLPNNSTARLEMESPGPDISGLDGHDSLPLQDVDANLSRHLSASATLKPPNECSDSLPKRVSNVEMTKQGANPLSDSVIPAQASVIPVESEPPAKEEKDYSDMLAQLRANRKATPASADQADDKRRKRRQLGRATSTRSNHSNGESSGQMGVNADDDEEETTLVEECQPSQELGWDSPGAAKAREQMIKKLGGTVKERTVPVQGIGVVKDVISEPNGRAGRKRRT